MHSRLAFGEMKPKIEEITRQHNKLKAYVEANPDEKIKQLQEEVVKYKRRCELIYDIGCDYDGFDTESASSMKDLVDELVDIACGDLEEGNNDLL